jgi:hypothetical protein
MTAVTSARARRCHTFPASFSSRGEARGAVSGNDASTVGLADYFGYAADSLNDRSFSAS